MEESNGACSFTANQINFSALKRPWTFSDNLNFDRSSCAPPKIKRLHFSSEKFVSNRKSSEFAKVDRPVKIILPTASDSLIARLNEKDDCNQASTSKSCQKKEKNVLRREKSLSWSLSQSFRSSFKRGNSTVIKEKRVIAKFLSSSVSKLHLAGSPLELYQKASNSLNSLTRIFDSSRQTTSSLKKHTESSSVKSVNFDSTSSIGRCSWPVPWLEAIFLPEFPGKTTINENDFTVLNCVGSGSFGNVYRVCLKHCPDVLYALKIQQKSEILTRNATELVKNEVSIHKSLSHCDFVVKCFSTWQSRSRLYTVLQYSMGYGDLYKLWQDYGPFSSSIVHIYAAEIALALEYIHRANVIYRDLKLENIMLTVNGHIQLIDFGFAKNLANTERTNTICGTLQYMAPEVARGEPYGKYIDWWCYGVLLHVLVTGSYPFPNSRALSHLDLKYQAYYSVDCEDDPLQNLIKRLLHLNLEDRICTFSGLRSHEFFQLTNWYDVSALKLDPYKDIKGLQRCESCNMQFDKSGSELEEEENWDAFDEDYEFDDPEYFCDTNLA